MVWYAQRLNPRRCWICGQTKHLHRPNGSRPKDLGTALVASTRIDNTLSCPPKKAGNALLAIEPEKAAVEFPK